MKNILKVCSFLTLGFTTTLHPKTQVISLAPNITETIFSIEAQEQLIGRTVYCKHPAEVTNVESVGSILQPDLEKILALQPSQVYASILTPPSILQQLNKLNVNTHTFANKTILDLSETLTYLGQFLNHEKEANILAGALQNLDMPNSRNKQSALIILGINYLYAPGQGTWLYDLFNRYGFKNIVVNSSSPWTQLSIEFILDKDPQVIFIAAKTQKPIEPLPTEALANLLKHPIWQHLSAVKANRVYYINQESISICSPHKVLSLSQALQELSKNPI